MLRDFGFVIFFGFIGVCALVNYLEGVSHKKDSEKRMEEEQERDER